MKIWLVTSIRMAADRAPQASTIQNLRMGAALAGEGAEVTVWISRLDGDTASVMRAWFDSPPPASMKFHCVAPAGVEGTKRTPFFGRLRGGRVLAEARARHGDPDAIISRSPLALEQIRSHPLRPRAAALILEYQYPEYMQLWRDWIAGRREREGTAPGPREATDRLRASMTAELRRLNAADAIMHCAPAHERLLNRAGFTGARISIPSGCVPPEPRADKTTDAYDESTPGAEFDIGYAGRVSAENGIETILRALSELDSMRLLIVGAGRGGWRERIEAGIGDLSLTDRVRIEGPVSPYRVREQLRRCAIGLVPVSRRCGPEKRDYASPLKLTDWLSAGVPVIASSVPSIMQHVTHDQHVRLVESDNPGALAREIRLLHADGAMRRRISAEGLALASELAYAERARRVMNLILSLRADRAAASQVGTGHR